MDEARLERDDACDDCGSRDLDGPGGCDSGDATVVETLLDTLLAGFVLPHSTTTILQDWEKGRRSEDINGHVVRTSERIGRDAPVNSCGRSRPLSPRPSRSAN
jgi:hypothetical protein